MFNHVIIVPTMSCNCRCEYCYENHAAVKMSDEVYDAIKRFLVIQKKKGAPRCFHLEFFGGEPLLCSEKVLELSSFARDLFSDSNCQYIGSMTTNATLLNFDVFKKLNESGVRYFQITFDGPRDFHNSRRFFVNGDGTFDTIWNNLMQAKKSDLLFEIALRLHVTPENVAMIEDFSKNELSVFLSDPRFKFFFHELLPLGGPHDSEIEMFRTSEEVKKVLEQLNSRATFSESSRICYAANPRSIVILPDMRLCKCTVTLDKSVCGELMMDGSLDMDNEIFTIWCAPYLYPEKKFLCPKNDVPELRRLYGISCK